MPAAIPLTGVTAVVIGVMHVRVWHQSTIGVMRARRAEEARSLSSRLWLDCPSRWLCSCVAVHGRAVRLPARLAHSEVTQRQSTRSVDKRVCTYEKVLQPDRVLC